MNPPAEASPLELVVRAPRILALCAGIGGLELGIKLATDNAARTVCICEGETYCAAVLRERMQDGHLDDCPIWTDLRTFDSRPWRGVVDCITGGFPCPPFSCAGKRLGDKDPRHLWPYILRHIETIRPTACFFENVTGLLTLGFEQVCQDLQRLGYCVTASIHSAEECGAAHQRQRLFFFAYAAQSGREARLSDAVRIEQRQAVRPFARQAGQDVADTDREGQLQQCGIVPEGRGRSGDGSATVANTNSYGRIQGGAGPILHKRRIGTDSCGTVGAKQMADTYLQRLPQRQGIGSHDVQECAAPKRDGDASVEFKGRPACAQVHRMVNGFPCELDQGMKKDAAKKKTRPDQALQNLPCSNGSKDYAIGEAGRHGHISQENILWPKVFWNREQESGDSDEGCVQMARSEVLEDILRKLRVKQKTMYSSQKQELDGQRRVELTDALQLVSHFTPSQKRRHQQTEKGTAEMRLLRQAVQFVGLLPKASESFQETWESLSSETQEWACCAAVLGPWHSEIPFVTRTTTKKEHRIDRLRALGNAVVPATAALAWRTLTTQALEAANASL